MGTSILTHDDATKNALFYLVQHQPMRRIDRLLYPLAGAVSVLFMLNAACMSNHHVSPFPDGISIADVVERPDLDKQLARLSDEISHHHMAQEHEIRGEFRDKSPFVIRSYVGKDAVGYDRHAVRVASPYGLILAIGPERDAAERGDRTQLRRSLLEGGGWRSGTDFNGDGLIDLILAGPDGTFEVWGFHDRGAMPYPMIALAPPSRAIDINEDGQPDPAVDMHALSDDTIRPRIVEVMSFRVGEYRNDTPDVRAYHAKALAHVRAQMEPRRDADGNVVPRLTREVLADAIEAAWHSIRSGGGDKTAIEELDRVVKALEPLPSEQSAAWRAWRAWIEKVGKQKTARER